MNVKEIACASAHLCAALARRSIVHEYILNGIYDNKRSHQEDGIKTSSKTIYVNIGVTMYQQRLHDNIRM